MNEPIEPVNGADVADPGQLVDSGDLVDPAAEDPTPADVTGREDPSYVDPAGELPPAGDELDDPS